MTDGLIYFEGMSSELALEPQRLSWLRACILERGNEVGEICIQFCSDEELRTINIQELDHDYYTDIITLDYVVGKLISGDLFISIDRVKENSQNMAVGFDDELDRVMIHGILHLMGYKDKSEEDQTRMRAEEDKCLNLRPFNH